MGTASSHQRRGKAISSKRIREGKRSIGKYKGKVPSPVIIKIDA